MMWKASSSNTIFTWLNFRTINLYRITNISDTNILAHFRLTKAHPSIDFFILARLDRHAFISRHFLFTVQWHHLLKKPTTKRTMARCLGTGKCGKLFLTWIPMTKMYLLSRKLHLWTVKLIIYYFYRGNQYRQGESQDSIQNHRENAEHTP
jgi:hypothetical protein